MRGLIGWLGGFFGAEGDELVEQEACRLREAMGRGLYTEDPETLFGRLLRVYACALAFARAGGEKLLRNANPPLAVDTLSEWEAQFGLADGNKMSVLDRQARLAAWLKWSRWASKHAINEFCLDLLGSLYIGLSSVGVNDYVLTVAPALYYPENAPLRRTMERYVAWVTPAHVKLTLTA